MSLEHWFNKKERRRSIPSALFLFGCEWSVSRVLCRLRGGDHLSGPPIARRL